MPARPLAHTSYSISPEASTSTLTYAFKHFPVFRDHHEFTAIIRGVSLVFPSFPSFLGSVPSFLLVFSGTAIRRLHLYPTDREKGQQRETPRLAGSFGTEACRHQHGGIQPGRSQQCPDKQLFALPHEYAKTRSKRRTGARCYMA